MLILLLWTGVSPSIAQVSRLIDSLNEQSVIYRDINLDTAVLLGERALKLSREAGLRDKEFASLINLCTGCFERHTFVESEQFCREVIEFEGMQKTSIVEAYIMHGHSNLNLGFFNKAIESFLAYVESPEVLSNELLLVNGLSQLGLTYLNDGNIPKATDTIVVLCASMKR